MTTTTTSAQAAERTRQKAAEKALERVSRAWGAHRGPEALKEALPLVYAKLEAAKETLEATWAQALAGRATNEQFNAVLKTWEETNYTAATALKAVRS